MKVQESITLIISRNYGRPISFSLPAWRFYALGAMAVIFLAAMLVLSFLFMVSYPRMQQIEQEHENLLEERDALREKILSRNVEAMDAKVRAFLALLNKKTPSNTVASKEEGEREGNYTPPIQLDSITTLVRGKTVEVAFQLTNTRQEYNPGGYLYAIFENEDKDPPEYSATPPVATNEEGFPQSYKFGVNFSRIRKSATFRRRIRRASKEDYYTHVTLFLFSIRGGLLLRERLELDRELFFQDRPAVRREKLSEA